MALEGLWWVQDGFFDIRIKDNWFYTLMIMVPDLVTTQIFAEALAALQKRKATNPGLRACAWKPSRKGAASR